jgi:hypothetical protein
MLPVVIFPVSLEQVTLRSGWMEANPLHPPAGKDEPWTNKIS